MSVVNASSDNSLKSLSAAMGRMFRDAAASGTSDVVVQCGQQEIPAHRIILMARYDVKCIYLHIFRISGFYTLKQKLCRSPVMERMFQTEMKEQREGVVNIDNFAMEDVFQMIEYMYTGMVGEGYSRFEMLLQLSNQYEVLDLFFLCANKMSQSLRKDNALEYGILGDRHNSEILVKNAAKYICANMNVKDCLHQEDWMQRMKTSPKLMTEIMKILADDNEAMKNNRKTKRWI